MQGGDDSPGYGESGFGAFSSSQPWRSSPTPPPTNLWSPQSPPPWQQTSQLRGQSSSQPQRNVGRPQSGFGDYRPNMDAINNPSQQFQSSQFQYTQSPLSESDRFTWEQLMGTPPDTPVSGTQGGRGRNQGVGGRNGDGGGRNGGNGGGRSGGGGRTAGRRGEQGTGGGGGRSGRRGGGRGGGDGGGGDGGGNRRSTYYSNEESFAVARAWYAVTADSIVGTDQTDVCFWNRVLDVYNEFKPDGSVERTASQVRKKFGRITKALKRFSGIYETQLRLAESGRTEADVRVLSYQLFNTESWPKFTYWDEYLVLRDCPKFRVLIDKDPVSGPKRTRLGVAGNYSSSSDSRAFDLNDDASEEEPPSRLSRRPRPQGQRAAIRESRTGSQFSAATSTAMPAIPRAALAHTLEVQMMKQLQDNLALYEKSTDPETKRFYYDLVIRLRSKLGWSEGSQSGGASGSGVGASGSGAGGGGGCGADDVMDDDDTE
ncbi:keratin, type I cytoskeletal 10-like [Salvia hispanica]|uniref:keratin, type I cytoskeletal 10-like n=1 Tax=Salvia hispanica TaxID=49212 RepID=UPI002009BC1C|nr:keratin, type I cytoskeletal 10-like [Salvia hispanica]